MLSSVSCNILRIAIFAFDVISLRFFLSICCGFFYPMFHFYEWINHFYSNKKKVRMASKRQTNADIHVNTERVQSCKRAKRKKTTHFVRFIFDPHEKRWNQRLKCCCCCCNILFCTFFFSSCRFQYIYIYIYCAVHCLRHSKSFIYFFIVPSLRRIERFFFCITVFIIFSDSMHVWYVLISIYILVIFEESLSFVWHCRKHAFFY